MLSVHKYFKCLDYYGDIDSFWDNFDPLELSFIDKNDLSQLTQSHSLQRIDDELEKLKNIKVLSYINFPEYLKEIDDMPIILYYRGEINFERYISIVGSRKCTKYGLDTAFSIGADLSKFGITIVSGGARGIDSAAHRGVLSVNEKTIAVMGCGLNVCYPPENRELFEKIVEFGGGLISEFPPDTPPDSFNFPRRNRIISGLSVATIIVESGVKSGTKITGRLALEQGRDLFCVPGNIDSQASLGTNSFIKQGAKIYLNACDILEEYNWSEKQSKKITFELNQTEEIVYNALQNKQSLNIEEIIDITGLEVAQLNSTLTMLELRGIIKQKSGKIFSL